jgi:anti-sigma regulatory factor (Ser/Thr protein kinase)
MSDAGEFEFKASSLADLERLVAFVERHCELADADADSRFALHLAAEEAFINVMQHGYGPGGGPVTVTLQVQDRRITLTLRDQARPFDPTSVPAPDLAAGWQQRAVGGLGLHLVQSLMNEVRYESDAGRENVLTLVKDFSGAATRP